MYRFVHRQGKLNEIPTPIDHVSLTPMSKEEGMALLRTEFAIHVAAGWEVRLCGCLAGFIALRPAQDVRRTVHVEEEDFLLAEGLLAPMSTRALGVV